MSNPKSDQYKDPMRNIAAGGTGESGKDHPPGGPTTGPGAKPKDPLTDERPDGAGGGGDASGGGDSGGGPDGGGGQP